VKTVASVSYPPCSIRPAAKPLIPDLREVKFRTIALSVAFDLRLSLKRKHKHTPAKAFGLNGLAL